MTGSGGSEGEMNTVSEGEYVSTGTQGIFPQNNDCLESLAPLTAHTGNGSCAGGK